MSERSRGGRVLLAQGSSRRELEQLVELLDRHGLDFEVEEDAAGQRESAPGTWRVVVPASDALKARFLLAAAGRRPARGTRAGEQVEEAPGPLYRLPSYDLLRRLLVMLCFGLAVWLMVRG
jgi:hypothetical protein